MDTLYELFKIQDEFNRVVNPNWLDDISPSGWVLAILTEIGELLEDFGWQWWKKQNSQNVDEQILNIYIELADLLHFVLSLTMKLQYDRISSQAKVESDDDKKALLKVYDMTLKKIDEKFETHKDEMRKEIDKMGNLVLQSNDAHGFLHKAVAILITPLINIDELETPFTPLFRFFIFANALGFETSKIIRFYKAKKILNEFRQKHGYKEGKYIKIWGDKEDNHELARFIINNPNVDDDEIYEFLESRYEQVINQSIKGGK